MNSCPLCESQYSDETLRFCLQDGTPLTTGVKQSSIETVAFNNPLTVEKIAPTEEMRVKFPNEKPDDKTHKKFKPYFVNPARKAEQSKSSSRFWLAVLPALVILGTAGFGGWFFLNQQTEVSRQNFNDKEILSNPAEKTLPVANTSVTSPETISENTTQSSSNADNSGAKKEITDFINLWKESFQLRNLVEFTAKYAEKVDYFDKTGTDKKEIRTEAQKIFTDYTEIEITLSNLHVAVDGHGDKATALFDKEWIYETGKDLSTGKAHTKLQFEKIGNQWKIVSEKILKTYYLEN